MPIKLGICLDGDGDRIGALGEGGNYISSHHIFAMVSLFDWPIVVLCVLATVAAGLVWSRMRLLGYSIWDCYISHVFADLAVMWIGYDLILRVQ